MPGIASSDIPSLRLSVLQGLYERFTAPPDLFFVNKFGEGDNAPSDTIEWNSKVGARTLAGFMSPGGKTPTGRMVGIRPHAAKAAFWGEKMPFFEEFLNNLRKEGTYAEKENAEALLSRELQQLMYRIARRKEWMYAQMWCKGGFSYLQKGGKRLSVDYGIPEAHQQELTTDYKWGSGTKSDILGDIGKIKLMLKNANEGSISTALMTSEVVEAIRHDVNLINLLKQDAYGKGNFFTATIEVLKGILNIGELVVYDGQFDIITDITGTITGGSTSTFAVRSTVDFEPDDVMRIVNAETEEWEEVAIASISPTAGTVTLTDHTIASYQAGRDFCYVTKKFLPTNQITLICDKIENTPTAKFFNAPFGIKGGYGAQVTRHEMYEPDGVEVRIQNKGLPVLYNRDAVVQLKVF